MKQKKVQVNAIISSTIITKKKININKLNESTKNIGSKIIVEEVLHLMIVQLYNIVDEIVRNTFFNV